MKKITAATKIKSLTYGQIGHITADTMGWCLVNMKKPKRKRYGLNMPKLSAFISKRKSVKEIPSNDARGEYMPYTNQIIVVPSNIQTVWELIETVIHEYTHSTQDLKHYNECNVVFGYFNNPYEVEARYEAALRTDDCCFDILS